MKAYLVLDFSVRDLAGFMPYVEAIPAFIEKHGGRYTLRIVATDAKTPNAGVWEQAVHIRAKR